MDRIVEWFLGAKPGNLAGQGQWRIGFIADFNSYVKLALILTFVTMVYLTIRSYRRERDAPRRIRATLAAVRVAVIVLAFVILFQPAVVLTFVKALHSSVVVLVDDSLSMSFKDRYADPELADRLVRFLKPKDGEPATQTGDNPQPTSSGTNEIVPGVLIGSIENNSRRNIVLAALTQPGGALFRLARDHPLVLMRFSTARPEKDPYTASLGTVSLIHPGPAGQSQTTEAAKELTAALSRLTANGYETNIQAALRDALERTEGQRIAGIVLISDGQVTTQGSAIGGAGEYADARGVPLYAVCVGDPTPPTELSVVGLHVPEDVRRGARVEFSALLAHRNLEGQTATVRLLHREAGATEWSDTDVSQTVKLTAPEGNDGSGRSRGVQTVALFVEPKELGQFVYRAVADPWPAQRQGGDSFTETLVTVSDEKVKVLLISSDAGWEFQYLRNYLLRAPEMYRLSVWQQNADDEINQVASAGMELSHLPRKLEELIGSPNGKPYPGYDVVILCDPQPTKEGFDGQFADMLRVFVQRHGKGLCYVAGNKYSDSVLRAEGPFKPLADLLPVELGLNTVNMIERIEQQRPEPWPARLTTYGADHAITRLGGSAEETKDIWRSLPGIFWSHPVSKIKPTARVLVENSNPLHRTSKNEQEPLIAVQPFGKGRVVYVGLESSWRWRYLRDGFFHQRLWGNLVRQLATLGSARVSIITGGDRFSTGERITIEVEAYDREYRPLKDETFPVVMVNSQNDGSTSLALMPVANKPGRYRIGIDAPLPGTYELRADGHGQGTEQEVIAKRIVVDPPKAETVRREADTATMRTIASRPENFLSIDELDKLTEVIPSGTRWARQEVPKELWDTRLALLLVVLLLGVEWIIRKKHNMA